MVKLQQVEKRFFVTVPADLVNQKGWKKGQRLFFVFNERGNVELTDSMRNKG